MARILKTATHDISRGFLIGFVALLIVLPSAFLGVVLLYENQQRALSDAFLIAAGILWMVVFLGGMLLFIRITQSRRKKWLDGVFAPLGLSGHRFLGTWWEYTGLYEGRELTARFYKGPTLDLILSTTLQTRFGVSNENELGDYLAAKLYKPALFMNSAEWQGITVHALDEGWFTQLSTQPEAVAALMRLLKEGEKWALVRQVILSPGSMRLTFYRNNNLFNYDFDTQEVRGHVEDLLTLAKTAEALPPPQITDTLSELEKNARSGKLGRRAVLILVLFFLMAGACFGLALWFLVRYGG
jgi:hypothetical protein